MTHKDWLKRKLNKTVPNLNSKKIPAVTIVAEWSKALTVEGAVIASVNQPVKGSCADFVKAAIIKDKDID